MFEKLQMKLAARKMQRSKEYAALDKKIMVEESALERVLLWPFRAIGFVCRWVYDTVAAIISWIWGLLVAICCAFWTWLCAINIVGLINLTLILAIIILFSFLIVDFTRCRRTNVVNAPAKAMTVETSSKSSASTGAITTTLPMRRNARTQAITEPVNVVGAEPSKSPILRTHGDGKIYGDIIIESRGDAIILKNNAHIRGNLYLQHMRKYILPCGVKIEGNLFLRDLNMLQFCGPFNITGNIYVSPRSSFGPIPRNSHLGGQIIL